ncbi:MULTISPECIES: hypothetical protein [unclassified Calothrix]|uniref:hypothetical protein n=1 Tax=unclassified Calothrix TaxID=2619626 RepID=UPI0016852E38|nr:hypothetical protein [Calothrix sp. FACHB-168]
MVRLKKSTFFSFSKPSIGTWAVGTPGYMPDKQAKEHLKLSSDVYVLGMIDITILT